MTAASESVILAALERLERKIDELTKTPPKDYYTVAEVAELIGRSDYQVRKWFREGRLRADRRQCGRGLNKEWMLPKSELDHYRSFGLRDSRD